LRKHTTLSRIGSATTDEIRLRGPTGEQMRACSDCYASSLKRHSHVVLIVMRDETMTQYQVTRYGLHGHSNNNNNNNEYICHGQFKHS